MTRTRLIGLGAGLVLAGLAFQAGEYSTLDWLTMRRQLAEEHAAVQELRVVLDSLNRLAHDLETNPAAQERAARERFGVIRNGEILYRLVPRSEATRSSRP